MGRDSRLRLFLVRGASLRFSRGDPVSADFHVHRGETDGKDPFGSGGRLDFGVGRGMPPELAGFGIKEDNRDMLVEGIEIVEMAWREGKVSYKGKYHQINGVSLNVAPIQRPRPPLYFACLSEGSYKVAGERGYPILGIPYASCKDIREEVMPKFRDR